jgi:hypothetical protein
MQQTFRETTTVAAHFDLRTAEAFLLCWNVLGMSYKDLSSALEKLLEKNTPVKNTYFPNALCAVWHILLTLE